MDVLTSEGVVEVDGFYLQDIVSVDNLWVYVYVKFSGIERGVVNVADGVMEMMSVAAGRRPWLRLIRCWVSAI